MVAGGAYAGLVLGACGDGGPDQRVVATDPAVQAAEQRRRRSGAIVSDIALTAAPLTIDLAGAPAATWAYGAVPGAEVRVRAGDVLRARVRNDLPDPTTIHWHGVALRNDMDGVPGLTQAPIAPGAEFTYEFTVPVPGTFWFHPHAGLQLDQGLYTPLIVEDPQEPGDYDREVVVVLDDWVAGVGERPEDTLAALQKEGMGMGGGGMGGDMGGGGMAMSPLLGGDAGDVTYPLHLVNGRPPEAPSVFEAKPGERLRLRLVNVASDTAYRVALGGHRLTVTHTDGFPVEPVTADTLLIGMSERYDVLVTVDGEGAFPLVALAEGKGAQAMAIVRSGLGDPPPATARPVELDGALLELAQLRAAPAVVLPARGPDRTHQVRLDGPGEGQYRWTINGKAAPDESEVLDDSMPLDVRQGERVRLVFENKSMMFHPMHLHGHTFQVVGPAGVPGPRKDSMIVRPMERIAVDFDADNPGQWLMHCHNLYHQKGGMHSVVSYVR